MAPHAAWIDRDVAFGVVAPSWVASRVSFAVFAGENPGATSQRGRCFECGRCGGPTMHTPKAPFAAEVPRRSVARIYDRPGAMALASRPLSLILLALLSAVVASVVYFNYYAS